MIQQKPGSPKPRAYWITKLYIVLGSFFLYYELQSGIWRKLFFFSLRMINFGRRRECCIKPKKEELWWDIRKKICINFFLGGEGGVEKTVVKEGGEAQLLVNIFLLFVSFDCETKWIIDVNSILRCKMHHAKIRDISNLFFNSFLFVFSSLA